MKRKDKCKAKTAGSIMVSAILAIFVWIGIAQSMAIIANSGFKSIKSGRTAIQAQQYADISIDRLKNINYDELDTAGAHTRAVISGLSTTDWEDEVTIGAESTIAGSDDAKQRIATVNVYKVGDTLPRYTVEVPLSSQSSSTNKNQYFTQDNGYYITSEGLIFQWGRINVMSTMEGFCKPEYFNIEFPNKCLNVQISAKSGYSYYHNANGWPGIVSWNNKYFVPYTDFADGIEGAIGAFWFAIGY